MSTKTITNNSVTYSNTIYAFGAGSGYFNGSNAYLSTPDSSDFNFSGDFTIDFLFYMNSPKYSYQTMFWMGTSANGGSDEIELSNLNSTKRLYCRHVVGGNYLWTVDVSSISALTNSTWHHLACVIYGTTATIYLDGISIGSSSISGSSRTPYFTDPVTIGYWPTQTRYFAGYIDEIRISNVARWTSNFTPPTTTYSTDANTVLLIHFEETNAAFIDSSGNTGTTYTLSIADGASGSTSIAKTINLSKSEIGKGSTSIAKTINLSKSEIGKGSTSIAKTINLSKSEIGKGSTSISKVLSKSLNETSNSGDSINKSIKKVLLENVNSSDLITKAITRVLSLLDNTNISDNITTVKAKILLITDNVNVSDNLVKSLRKNINENSTVLDSITKIIGLNKAESSSVSTLLQKIITKQLTENILDSDNINLSRAKILAFNDNIKISDIINLNRQIVKSFIENITNSDLTNFVKSLYLSIDEQINIQTNLIKTITKQLQEQGYESDEIYIRKILPFIFNALFLVME